MLGYFDDQIATAEAFNSQGWFMTGDLGGVDENGYLCICGRLKEVIIRGGRKIYPTRIEALALRHPAIERAAAFAVADERLGAVMCRGSMPRCGNGDPRALACRRPVKIRHARIPAGARRK